MSPLELGFAAIAATLGFAIIGVPIGPAMRRFPIKFYLVAVLFILFDIEVVFFLPFAVVTRQVGLFALIEMGVFIAILLIGYAYAWRKGALEWE